MLDLQRDHYLPLRVIRDHLDAMDRGLEPPVLPGRGPRAPRWSPGRPDGPADRGPGRDDRRCGCPRPSWPHPAAA